MRSFVLTCLFHLPIFNSRRGETGHSADIAADLWTGLAGEPAANPCTSLVSVPSLFSVESSLKENMADLPRRLREWRNRIFIARIAIWRHAGKEKPPGTHVEAVGNGMEGFLSLKSRIPM